MCQQISSHKSNQGLSREPVLDVARMKDEFHRRMFAGLTHLPDFPAILGLACDGTPLDLTPHAEDAETNQIIRTLHALYNSREASHRARCSIALVMACILCDVPHTKESIEQGSGERTVRFRFTGIKGCPFFVALNMRDGEITPESDHDWGKTDGKLYECYNEMFGAISGLERFLLHTE